MRSLLPVALATILGVSAVPWRSAAEVSLTVDPESGRWSLDGPALRVADAGVSIQVGGQSVEPLGRPEVSAPEPVSDALGAGRRTIISWPSEGGLALSVRVRLYETRALVEALCRNEGDEVQQVSAFQGLECRVQTQGDARKCRVFRNSGSQGASGVWPVGDGGHSSAYVTCVFDPEAEAALAVGMVSYHRADVTTAVSAADEGQLALAATAAFSDLPLAPGDTLSSEAYLLEWGSDPLALLERYADAVAQALDIHASEDRRGFWNVWYAYTETENSADHMLECARYQAEHLAKWGFPWFSVGIWQRENAFGARRPKPDLYPQGMAWLADRMREAGVRPMIGAFSARVSECTEVFAEHPEYMVGDGSGEPLRVGEKSWSRCPYPHYLPDMTHPGAQAWYRDMWQSFLDWGYGGYFWLDFEGTSGAGERHDPTLNAPFETDRLRLGIIRDVVGPDVHLGAYTSPTNRYAGLVDRMRMAADVGRFPGNREHLRGVARNMAAAWFYHNRVWVNNPDPIMVGLQPDPWHAELSRVRLLLGAMTGGFVTLGERMPEMAPEQFRLLTVALPPYPEAARPVDLFRSEVPEIQDLTVETDWDTWHVVSVINWDDPAPLEVEVEADSEGIASNGVPYSAEHAFDGVPGVSLASPGDCWAASREAPAPHWISLRFPEPREVARLTIHWTRYGGFDPEVEWWTSQRYAIQAWQEGDWRTVAEVENDVPVAGLPVTTHDLPAVRTDGIRIVQPEGGGHPRRPQMMAIGEITLEPVTSHAKDIRVDFAELGLDGGQPFLVYEFWSQELLGTMTGGVTVSVPAMAGRLLCIRPVPEHPWPLSTDLHVTQGGVELTGVSWDAQARALSGVAQRPGESGHVVIYVPDDFAASAVSVQGEALGPEMADERVLRIPMAFDGRPVPWRVEF